MLTSRSSVTLLVALISVCALKGTNSSLEEDRLLVELFENRRYNKLSHPVKHLTETVEVQFALVLQKVVEMDELHEVLRASLWCRIKWKDYRLQWNRTEFDDVASVYVPAVSLWYPDITLMNSARDGTKTELALEVDIVRISSDGTLFWTPNSQTLSYCPMDITWFPFDDQRCSLIYESWKRESKELNVTFMEPAVDLKYYKSSGEWTLVGTPVEFTLVNYVCCETPFARLNFTIHIRRKSMYYIVNLVIPYTVFSIITCATFLLHPACGERLGVGVTLLLSLSVYQMIVNEKLPATSDAVPLLGRYFTFVMVICAISVVVTIIVLNMQNHSSSFCLPLPRWAKLLFCGRLARLLRVENASQHATGTATGKRLGNAEDNHQYALAAMDDIDRDDIGRVSDLDFLQKNSGVELLRNINKLLLNTLKKHEEQRHEKEMNDIERNNWIVAVSVIDRLCFLVFTVSILVGTLTIFVLAYLHNN